MLTIPSQTQDALNTTSSLLVSGKSVPASAVEAVTSITAGLGLSIAKSQALVNLGTAFLANALTAVQYMQAVSILLTSRTTAEMVALRLKYQTPDPNAIITIATLSDYDGKTDLYPSILSANLMVNRVVENAAKNCYLLADTGENSEAENIERWLACFYYQITDPPYVARSIQGSSATFGGQLGDQMAANRYGQQAMVADTSGELMKLGMRKIIAGGLNAVGAVARSYNISRGSGRHRDGGPSPLFPR